MDSAQIKSNLERLFAKGSRIVFWRDEDAEFEEMLPGLDLDGVAVVRLEEVRHWRSRRISSSNNQSNAFFFMRRGLCRRPKKTGCLIFGSMPNLFLLIARP